MCGTPADEMAFIGTGRHWTSVRVGWQFGATAGVQAPGVYGLCMARRNISLPDDLDERARRARLNVSALAQRAVADELDRRERMRALDVWLDELDAAHGAPSEEAEAHAQAWLESAVGVQSRPPAPNARSAAPDAQRAAG